MTEDERLKSLFELELLDTPDELEYDQLVHLASQVCDAPISLVSLVDHKRQWFKAAYGLATRETHRDVSFCSHAILQPNLFIIEDATKDNRFKDNALVTSEPNIRFYAGIPIHAPNGSAVGTLCVIDTEPRTLSESQRQALTILGLQVQARMDLRYKNNLLERTLAENIRLNQTLQASNNLFQGFMDNGPFISYIKDSEGRFVFYNSHLAERFGIQPHQWMGMSVHDLFAKELADPYRQNDLEVLASGTPREFEEISPGPDGEPIHWRSYKFPIRGAHGEKMLAGISVDVTEELNRQRALSDANTRLELLATTDSLTGLFNRRVFQGRIEVEFSVAMRKDRPLTLAILDVDDFKKRNDTSGHAAGDAALQYLGATLLRSVRKGDLPVRLGGEEFAILLPDTEIETAVSIAERIQASLRESAGAPPNLTVSIGIAATDGSCSTWEQLLSHADNAMYQAKRAGKDRIVLYESHVENFVL